MYVTADLYQAKRQDKSRIVCRYKINMLSLVPRGGGKLPYERGGDAHHLASALGYLTAMCSPGWGDLVAIDWNDLPVGREFDCKFLKNVTSPPHALPPPPPALQ